MVLANSKELSVPFRSFRVEALKRLLRKSGFSRGAALKMSSCVRESTARLYQSQWLSFCGWCRGRGVAPIDATIPLIVDFLIHLRRDKGFSLSVLKGYRSAINSVLALKGTGPRRDTGTHHALPKLREALSHCRPAPPGLGCGAGPQQPHCGPLRAPKGCGGVSSSS